MSISLLLEMATAANPDRVVVSSLGTRLTSRQLSELAAGGAATIAGAAHVAYVGSGGTMLPLLLFSCSAAGVAFTPLNYRLSTQALQELIQRLPTPMVVVDDEYRHIIGDCDCRVLTSREFIAASAFEGGGGTGAICDPDAPAVVLFTSGTTSEPKAVELTHNNLTSYVTGTVEFDSATAGDAALICVPPYHIAGVGAALSNLFAGRRMVYLPTFDPEEWVRLVAEEAITTATVVPTMLDRIVTVLEATPTELPTLRNLAYGGSRIALPLVRRALQLLPHVGFVNAYGLTETSSTVAVLTPDDHRAALAATEAAAARRLGSVGRTVPGIELEIRNDGGAVLGPGQVGELFVRGEQVSGRYTGIGSVLDDGGWFATKDIAWIDEAGYLYIGGRSDDTIIRGGENIAPAEIEDVLVEHAHVRQCVVVGVDDDEWGQISVAVVVPANDTEPDPAELRDYVRARLRGSRTPDRIVFRTSLPTNATGKIVRRDLVDSLRWAVDEP